jgi:hypothetical protein
MSQLDSNTRQLAAAAYGEASVANDSNEIGSIAFAIANRARAWGNKTVQQLFNTDPNYSYAIIDGNKRYDMFMKASEDTIEKNAGMKLALDWAKKALENKTADPSNGAYWWDGADIKPNYSKHPKVKDGIHFGDPKHNIYNLKESSQGEVTIYWKVRNKRTGEEVNSKIRGSYSHVWISTAAYGGTIFWKYDSDFLKATGAKDYK